MEIKDIEKLSELAKIELTEKEKKELLKDVDSILNYVKVIEKVEAKDEEAEYDNKNVWREDEDREVFYDKDLIIEQFPDKEDGYMKVKKIL
jgi:aspartyl-tRNA(Asn)/glutamyl-tRNA(Gln) amidotransferase subunit C